MEVIDLGGFTAYETQNTQSDAIKLYQQEMAPFGENCVYSVLSDSFISTDPLKHLLRHREENADVGGNRLTQYK